MFVKQIYKRLVYNKRKWDAYLDEITENQEKILNEITENQEKIIDRIKITESNLNYYNMIHNIMDENKYVNLELMVNQIRSGKNILLAGFYGAYNLGDELMLQILVKKICKKNYGNLTIMICDNEQYDICDFPDVQFVHFPKNCFDFNIIAQRYDTLIWGGGALIDDSKYYDKTQVNYLGNMLIDLSNRFLAFKKKVYFLGLSANKELENEQYVERLGNIVEYCEYFSVRDEYSRELLIRHGMQREKVSLLYDIVFADSNWSTYISNREIRSRKNKEDLVIGIAFVCIQETKALLKELLKFIKEFQLKGHKIKVMLLPFYNYNENDILFYRTIIHEMSLSEDDVILCNYCNSLENLMDIFGKIDCMVNMRYHAMLLSMALGMPSLNFVLDSNKHYYNKMLYLAEFGNYKDSLVHFCGEIPDELEKKVERIILGERRPYIDKDIFQQTELQINNVLEKI